MKPLGNQGYQGVNDNRDEIETPDFDAVEEAWLSHRVGELMSAGGHRDIYRAETQAEEEFRRFRERHEA